MKFGIRAPSLNKRIAARTSVKRVFRHSLGFKAPRGYGWFTNPKRATYNRIYNRTTVKADGLIALAVVAVIALLGFIVKGVIELFSKSNNLNNPSLPSNVSVVGGVDCPHCGSSMVLRNGRRGQFYGCSRFPSCRGTRDYQATT